MSDDKNIRNDDYENTRASLDEMLDELEKLENETGFKFSGSPTRNVGYKAMGEYWTELLADYLGGEAPVTTSATIAETTTTSTVPEHTDIMVNDLVAFSRYLLGDRQTAETYAEQLRDYDLVRDGRLDMFDLVEMRKLLVSRAAPVGG